MAALDPKYEFTFAPGAPTVGDINAAAGAPLLTVAAVHYLHVASGGALRAAPGAANRFIVPWTDVDIAMLKVHNLDAAFHGTPSAGRITNLRAMHDAFQRAAAGGLTFDILGSVEAALAQFVRVSRALAMQSPTAWELGAANFQALPAAPNAAAALPPEAEWFLHLEFSMGATASYVSRTSLVGGALPCGSPLGRAGPPLTRPERVVGSTCGNVALLCPAHAYACSVCLMPRSRHERSSTAQRCARAQPCP